MAPARAAAPGRRGAGWPVCAFAALAGLLEWWGRTPVSAWTSWSTASHAPRRSALASGTVRARDSSLVTRRVSGGVGDNAKFLPLIWKRTPGFKPVPGSRWYEPEKKWVQEFETASIARQADWFATLEQAGMPVAQAFARVDGVVPWKYIGRLTAVDGDFIRAVQCQHMLLYETARKVQKKFQFYSAQGKRIEFGFAAPDFMQSIDDVKRPEDQTIWVVDRGLPIEEYGPKRARELLRSIGFQPVKKDKTWQTERQWLQQLAYHEGRSFSATPVNHRHEKKIFYGSYFGTWTRNGAYRPTKHDNNPDDFSKKAWKKYRRERRTLW